MRISTKELDEALAHYLMRPDSRAALNMAREARTVRIDAELSGRKDIANLCTDHHNDCLKLHDAVLTLESDPEIVKRNLVARVISGVFPVLNAVEEFRSFEDRSVWDMLINSFGVLSEIATATQYLEATRLSASAHNERVLVEIEERMVRMARLTQGDLKDKTELIENFLDSVREIKINPREKPLVPFVIWSLIVMISYKHLKERIDVQVSLGKRT